MSDLKLDEFLPYRLRSTAEKVSLGFSQTYRREYGLNRPEWRVLASLAQLGKTTATKVGAHSSMHKTKVSRAVFELERRMWLLRSTDQADRRVEWLELTRLGRSNFSKLASLAKSYQVGLLQKLGQKQGAQLMAILDRLDQIFDETRS